MTSFILLLSEAFLTPALPEFRKGSVLTEMKELQKRNIYLTTYHIKRYFSLEGKRASLLKDNTLSIAVLH